MPYSSVSELPANVQKKPAKQQRQWMHIWNSSYSACMAKPGASASKCEGEAFARANGVVKGAEMPDDLRGHHEMGQLQLEKADPRVQYSDSASGGMCGSCRFFDSMCATCAIVEGSIDAAWGCKLWSKPLSVQPMADMEDMMASPSSSQDWNEAYQVFVDVASTSFSLDSLDLSKPGWIPFLPKPGRFQHPAYGTIEITPQQNQEMVASVTNHVYQDQIPLDAEHETKLSGAVAWIKDMRMNADGSADAFVDWTDRGRQLVESGQFKYISPEWFATWRDPGTGTVHRNVVAGGAITTRPFFKDKVLRALVASERNEIIANEKESRMPEDQKKTGAEDQKKEPVTFTEAQVKDQIDKAVEAALSDAKKATEAENQTFAERLTAAEAKAVAAEGLAAAEKTAREALAADLAVIKTRERAKRFTELVAGTGGANDGGAWVGEQAKHVVMLERLADAFGEDNEAFTSYVEQQNAIAAQFKEAALFTEVGSSAGGGTSDPERKIDALVKARMASDKELTEAKAYSEVMETAEGKRLYAESVAPQRGA